MCHTRYPFVLSLPSCYVQLLLRTEFICVTGSYSYLTLATEARRGGVGAVSLPEEELGYRHLHATDFRLKP